MNDWGTPTAVMLVVSGLAAAASAWLKDRREARLAASDTDKRRFDLDVDLRREQDKMWRAVLSLRKGLLAVAQSIRTDEQVALEHGDLSAARAHRVDAERIEAALVLPE